MSKNALVRVELCRSVPAEGLNVQNKAFSSEKGKRSLRSNKIPVLIDYICIIKWNSPTMAFAWIVN